MPRAASPMLDSTPLRDRLGIPPDAQRVLVFTESSHWDTNWLESSEAYLRRRIEPIFSAILSELEADRRRVYSIESVFFLRLYWERHPEDRSRIRSLLEPDPETGRPRLRLMGASLTTPDTLLPHPEALLRDFLLGQDWLRREGLTAHPRTAYFPDNFGHSPHLPSLMRAVGVDAVGVTRIDGMYFIASDFRRRSAFPRRGSTAELLQRDLKTLDFVWRDDDGAEVVCHWNAFTYFQGDMLAHAGIIRWNGNVFAVPWRTRGHVRRRVEAYVRALAPLARTPFLLCPIGMDFNDPIPDLCGLLDRYNREEYPRSGTWTLVAGLDDYFELLAPHRAELPVLTIDPNPYWMGFYASRPEVKQRPTRVARALVLAEKLSATAPPSPPLEAALARGWESVVLMNHHDAITGTSPDDVTHGEQRRWLEVAEGAAAEALARASEPHVLAPQLARRVDAEQPRYERTATGLVVATDQLRLVFSTALGGAITSMVAGGREQLDGFGFDLTAYADEGGLWRLGHEFVGGAFKVVDRTSFRPAELDVEEHDGQITVTARAQLEGRAFVRRCVLRQGDPFIRLAVEGSPRRRHTVTARFELVDQPAILEMDTIGGTIERPRERTHRPTFWPVPSLVSVRGDEQSLHVGFESVTAVSFSPEHELEWIVARNPTKERAFGFLPVLAHPIGGTSDEPQAHRAALFATSGGPDHRVSPELRRELELEWFADELRDTKRLARALVRCDDADVAFSAIKHAQGGEGVILRLACEAPRGQTVQIALDAGEIIAAFESDAREQDGGPLPVLDGRARVRIARRLTTIRLLLRSGPSANVSAEKTPSPGAR